MLLKQLLSNYRTQFTLHSRQFHDSLMADAPRYTGKAPVVGGCYSGVQAPSLGRSAGHPPEEGDLPQSRRKPKVTNPRTDMILAFYLGTVEEKQARREIVEARKPKTYSEDEMSLLARLADRLPDLVVDGALVTNSQSKDIVSAAEYIAYRDHKENVA